MKRTEWREGERGNREREPPSFSVKYPKFKKKEEEEHLNKSKEILIRKEIRRTKDIPRREEE